MITWTCDRSLRPRTPSLASADGLPSAISLEPLCSVLISKGPQKRAQSKAPLDGMDRLTTNYSIEKGDAALSDQKKIFATKALSADVCENIPSSLFYTA